MQIKLVILDRDGVINFDSTDYIKSPEEWHPIPGSLQAIAQLKHQGLKVAIATNQSGIGRQFFSIQTLEAIHQKMKAELAAEGGELDGIFFCPHLPDESCDCRKPKPGLLHQIESELGIPLSQSCLIGDSFRDIQAALATACRPIWVESGKPLNRENLDFAHKHHVPVFKNLSDASAELIKSLQKTAWG